MNCSEMLHTKHDDIYEYMSLLGREQSMIETQDGKFRKIDDQEVNTSECEKMFKPYSYYSGMMCFEILEMMPSSTMSNCT